MVRRHRKLFPISTNQTTDCYKFCDPACSFNCYSYPYYYYYYTSPPPPESHPPPLFSAVEDPSHQNNHASLSLIILASLFAGLFLLAAYFVINKTCSFLCCNNQDRSPSVQDNTNEEFLDENQVDHPIWYITTVGLQQSIINSITICRYKKGEGLVEGTECSVCLGEFQEDETLRLLPKCSHAFHISCIDTWLRSHTNCPLCRAIIVSNNGNSEIYMPALPSTNQMSDHSSGDEETQIEDSGNLGNNSVVVITGISENRTGTGNEEEPQVTHGEMKFKEHVHDNINNSETRQTDNGEIEVNTISKDSSSGPAESSFAEPERNKIIRSAVEQNLHVVCVSEQDGECSSLFTKMSHSTMEKYLHMRPVSMKRSSSCGGRIAYHER